MTLSHCIDMLPYILICIANPYSVRVLYMCVCVCMHVLCMRVHRFGYIYIQVSLNVLGYVTEVDCNRYFHNALLKKYRW